MAFQLPVAKVLGNDETAQKLMSEGIKEVQNAKIIGALVQQRCSDVVLGQNWLWLAGKSIRLGGLISLIV